MTTPENKPHPSSRRKMWNLRRVIPADVRSALARYPPVLSQLLYNRGISSASEARSFLSKETIFHDPFALPDMEKAARRLKLALERKERIAVFGDFDVDGVTATALLAHALRPLGCQIVPYIPHRVEEGHGLSHQAVLALARQQVGLLITVDCGVTSYEEIEAATKAGIDTIVTDHHLAPEGPPPACAVVDPKLPESHYPFPHLTGAGLALKLAAALYQHLERDKSSWPKPLFPLASLGTIADVAPLLDENRSIVRQGLAGMRPAPTPGLRALLRSAGLEGKTLDTESISWGLAPRLNAAGRMDHANVSYELLVTDSDDRATALAETLEQQNRERQRLTAEAQEKARTLVEPSLLIMVGDPSFSPGIIGLVAGKLVEEFGRPAVVVSPDPGSGLSRGSCRSIPEFDIATALHRVAPAIGGFTRYGGHPQAAGFLIPTSRLPLLRQRLMELARETLGEKVLAARLDIDLEMSLGNLPRETYRAVEALAPFGAGNPEPVFLTRNVQLVEARAMGSSGEHLWLKLRHGGATWNAVAFGQRAHLPPGADSLDVAYTLEKDRWGAEETLRLRVLDLRPAKAPF